jgi:hypothetical protein
MRQKISTKEAVGYLKDPREYLGQLAEKVMQHSNGETKKMAEEIYGMYQQDLKKTINIAKKFKNVEDLLTF